MTLSAWVNQRTSGSLTTHAARRGLFSHALEAKIRTKIRPRCTPENPLCQLKIIENKGSKDSERVGFEPRNLLYIL
jgi:hypothetical protein